jgi:hypothetical protein
MGMTSFPFDRLWRDLFAAAAGISASEPARGLRYFVGGRVW